MIAPAPRPRRQLSDRRGRYGRVRKAAETGSGPGSER
jgi:hypothetical protein